MRIEKWQLIQKTSNVTETRYGDGGLSQDEGSILPLMQIMDGNYQTHLLFILTSNRDLNPLFDNRLGRIRYRKEYDKLSYEVSKEYLLDILNDGRIKDLENVLELLEKLGCSTYDILSNYADELNHTDGTPLEVLQTLNVKYEVRLYTISVRDTETNETFKCNSRRLNAYFGELYLCIDDSDKLPDGDFKDLIHETTFVMDEQKVERIGHDWYKFKHGKFEICLSQEESVFLRA